MGAVAVGAAVAPDVPGWRVEGLGLADLPDFGGGDTLVVAVVPLGDFVGDGHAGVTAGGAVCGGWLGLPGERVVAAYVEEFEGALGAGAGRDVAVRLRVGLVEEGWKLGERWKSRGGGRRELTCERVA